ncbi:MAG: bifunctional hydroxymethylpyrimidine kinase/phosphomethylpyrimidine kinase [Proteobacteria bacterium]|nr:bifunctional hydroxymethylpyrimidine kinase/phosphomethylpyrimidine kinase [Pseudomonadota bacterium]
MRPATVLTIGGSDPSGCGGIQGDLKVFSAFDVFGMSLITALTCQNSIGVSEVMACPASFVSNQGKSIFSDIPVDAVKIGMLSRAENVEAVAALLGSSSQGNVVLDPVLVSSSGKDMLDEDGVDILVNKLIPIVDLVTPNLREASVLANMPVTDLDEMKSAAAAIWKMGCSYVLVKGGHLEGRALDILFDGASYEEFDAERVGGGDFRGTGCALSAAIAAGLAGGASVPASVKAAKTYVTGAIRSGYRDLGRGMGILNHNSRN